MNRERPPPECLVFDDVCGSAPIQVLDLPIVVCDRMWSAYAQLGLSASGFRSTLMLVGVTLVSRQGSSYWRAVLPCYAQPRRFPESTKSVRVVNWSRAEFFFLVYSFSLSLLVLRPGHLSSITRKRVTCLCVSVSSVPGSSA